MGNLINENLETSQDDVQDFDLVQDESLQDDSSDEISFEDLGLDEITLEAIKRKGFVTPSPIQVLAIPRLLNGEANVIARARTGTGKTAAFGLPLVQTIREDKNSVRAVILEPTRELAMQTCTELASFTSGRFPRTAVVYGGASIGEQIRSLKKGCEIVVGTPGRVQDLIERGVLDLSKIEYFILDEGDEMLDMGFLEDIENIFSNANPDCRILLFSATVPSGILKIAQEFMGEYEIVEEEGVVEEPLLIDQKYCFVRQNDKIEALVRVIDFSEDFFGLVFVQKKTDADYVSKALDERGYEVGALHGDIPQGQREKILSRFRSKKTRILVATDVAARGIDIEGLTHVINYELPFDGPTYVHRIGRTGRAGSKGNAITFVRPEERRRLQFLRAAIRRSAKGEMSESKIPSVDEVISAKKERLFDDIKQKLNVENPEEISSLEKTVFTEETVFTKLAEELCNGKNPQEVVASLLTLTYGNALNPKKYGRVSNLSFDNKTKDSRRERNSKKGKEVYIRENQIRLYVQMGWKDGYTPKKIAEFFTGLLHIHNHDIDAIDMADKFCLLSLPIAAGKKALDMVAKDSRLPHMHQDTKVIIDYGDKKNKKLSNELSSVRDNRDDRKKSKDRAFSSSKKSERAKKSNNARPNVHTGTKRKSQASLYKKSSSAKEY